MDDYAEEQFRRMAEDARRLQAIERALLRGWPDIVTGYTDPEDYGEILRATGLAELREVTEFCGDACGCEIGDMCWQLTERGREVQRALDEREEDDE